ncbi:MAG TPA: calcium-binding protein, partial [Microvirga sp.]|nr:calcium-binding protein [Microvirga sp.]
WNMGIYRKSPVNNETLVYNVKDFDMTWGQAGHSTSAPSQDHAPTPAPSPAPTPEAASQPAPAAAGKVLKGSSANNALSGTSGDDKIYGRAGNDKLIGRGGNDELSGSSGNDRLYGGSGNDVLKGGAGRDSFVFNTKLGASNVDRVSGFSVKDDTVRLDNAIFGKLGKAGKLKKGFFTIGSEAKDKNDYVVYDKKKGILYYDADGSGQGEAVMFAKIAKNLKMTHDDFYVI